MTLLLALFLTLAPERPIAPPLLETGTYAGNVRIASNGDLVLAVWEDRRSGGSDILAARIDRDGQVLDPQGVVVAGAAYVPEERPAVVWDGARFVVFWFDPFGLHAATVDLDGHVTATGTVDRNATALLGAARGHGGVLLAIRSTNGGDSAGFLRADFAYEKTVTLAFITSPVTQLVAWDEGFLLLWPEASGLRVQRLDRDGHPCGLRLDVPLGPNVVSSLATATDPNGDALVAVAGEGISVTRIHPGTLPAMKTNRFRGTPHRVDAIVPRAGGFDVVAAEYQQPHVYRFGADDALAEVDTPVAAFTDSGGGADTAGRTFAAWEGFGQLTGAFAFDAAPAVEIAKHAPPQRLPVLARNGERALLAWNEDDRVMAEWIALDGTPLTEPVLINNRRADDPLAAACDTISCTLAFTHEETVLVFRLRDDFAPSLPLPLLPGTNPALASSGADTLLAWLDPSKQVKAALLSTKQPVDLPGSVTMPAVAFGGGSFLVVSTSANRFLRGTIVGTDGSVLAVHDYTSSPVDSPVGVTWDGQRFLIVFVRDRGLKGLLVDEHGVGDGSEFTIVARVQQLPTPPSVVWDGTAHIVAWNGSILRVGIDGSLLAEEAGEPSLLAIGGRRTLAAYRRPVPELTSVPRVFTRVVRAENLHGLTIAPDPIVVEVGKTKTVTVSAAWAFALTVSFLTRNPAIATVSGTLSPGAQTATLTITGVALGDTELWDLVPNFGRAPGSALVTMIHVRGPRRQAIRH